ncbi:FG-GAP-like repeat-containing protein [Streptomyces sp. R41]|uniref:FG-GAP-like repeat-containing protein n=1 Tax=Streptomyces sp. R41 TaxID=3238632 RepID=A0AB39R9R3_9ACTN
MHLPLRRVLACAATAALAAGGLALTTSPEATAAPAQQLADDFNGDGYRDVVLNLPFHSTSTRHLSGAAMVLYGSASGLSSTHRKLITQNTAGVPGTAESVDWFGHASTTGDFDGDGYADLAVSAPREGYVSGDTTWTDAGQVTLIWGGPDGLTHHGGTTVKLGTPTADRQLVGIDLASGDFNGDGKRDLVVGNGRGGEAGTLLLGPFTRTGSAASRKPLGVATGTPYYAETMLATGDLTGDGVTDLLVSWDTGTLDTTQGIHVLRGGSGGLTDIGVLKDAGGSQINHRESERLAIGDLDRDGRDDVVVPQPFALDHKGEFLVVYGGTNGQDPARKPVHFSQDTPGVPDSNSDVGSDHFGKQVAVGDVNADGYLDVIATSPGENHSNLSDPGKVTVLRGGPGGLTGSGATAFTQNTPGVPGESIRYGGFGSSAKATDVNGDGRADALIGVFTVHPGGADGYTGGLWAFPGSATGTTATGSKAFPPTSLGFADTSMFEVGKSFNR